MSRCNSRVRFVKRMCSDTEMKLIMPRCIAVSSVKRLTTRGKRFSSRVIKVSTKTNVVGAASGTVKSCNLSNCGLLASDDSAVLTSLRGTVRGRT